LSLLAINAPFTPSALTTVLQEANDAALPGLVAAALLTGDAAAYPPAFHKEAHALVSSILQEYASLLVVLKTTAQISQDASARAGLREKDKNAVTVAAGRVWAACDELAAFTASGVVGFVVKKAGDYHDLVKDAIRELREWDPEDDEGDGFDLEDFGSDTEPELDGGRRSTTGGAGGDDGEDATSAASDDEPSAELLNRKKQHLLRMLDRIAGLYNAITKLRLAPLRDHCTELQTPLPSSMVARLSDLLAQLRSLPDCVDEAAGCLFESDLPGSAANLAVVVECAKAAVSIACKTVLDRDGAAGASPSPEDRFAKWATTFAQVVDSTAREDTKPV
ncbi:hypothetical protein KEM52_003602, partial [Ascosphaera acerosa]